MENVAETAGPIAASRVALAAAAASAAAVASGDDEEPAAVPPPVAGAAAPGAAAAAARSAASIVPSATAVTLQRTKGGYLYIRVLEAANLANVRLSSRCACRYGCCAGPSCGSRAVPKVWATISCPSLERPANSQALPMAAGVERVSFREELLVKSLDLCFADVLTIRLLAGRPPTATALGEAATLGEATLPLRAALPAPLARGLPPVCMSSGGVSLSDPGAAEEAALNVLEPKDWLPVQRITLKRQNGALGTGPQPYIEVQLLQLVDASLPRLRGTSPLMMAVENRQEQLVRAYLSLDVVETMPVAEQEACVTAAVDRRYRDILSSLLDRIRPVHQHLMSAIRLHAEDLVEVLLHAGGGPLLRPRPRAPHRTNAPQRLAPRGLAGVGRLAGTAAGAAAASRQRTEPARLDTLAGGGGPVARGLPPSRPEDGSPPRPPLAVAPPLPRPNFGAAPLTLAPGSRSSASTDAAGPARMQRKDGLRVSPLALACSLGHVEVAEALCSWARRERVHIDPTAPTALADMDGGMSPMAPVPPRAGAVPQASSTGELSGAALWWDPDDAGPPGVAPRFGDPPMVMSIRGCGTPAAKLRLVNLLARFGFQADVKSPVDSWTPLMAAVELGSLELTTTLVKLGARLSADRNLGFTPLHLACQMGHWHLVPLLAKTMSGQYGRVAAWGPSPQYVSLNLVDAYGRTALDISLLRYFANPLPSVSACDESSGKSPAGGSERQKAADILREFVHRSPPGDDSTVCGWELFHVLQILGALPSRKAVGVQLLRGDWASDGDGTSLKSFQACGDPGQLYGDTQELLQAVRVLVLAGAQSRHMMQDLFQPPGFDRPGPSDLREAIVALGSRGCSETSCKYSPIDTDDLSDLDADDAHLPSRPRTTGPR